MEQTFIRLLTSLIVILSSATSIFSADVEYKGIYYNIVGNELSVTYRGSWYGEFDEYRGNIIIPQEVPINKTMYKVTSIGDCAFSGCSSLKTVSIPNSVSIIGDGAFGYCSSLKTVSIPNSVSIIGDGAFGDCSSLKTVSIPSSVTWIGEYVFSDCTALETIEIPTSVTYIKEGSFSGCIKLTSINIPNSITTIGNYVFSGCSALESIEIPNSVNLIGSYAFSGCNSLKSIEIPNSVNFIGTGAFSGCNSLTKAVFVDGIVELEILDLDNDTSAEYDIFKYSPLEEVYLGRNLSPGTIFAGQENLKKVSIGNTVTKISSHTFQGCSSLESVSISNSVTTIGDCAFSDCSALKSIEIPNGVTWIGKSAFSDCSALKSIEIPNGVTWIGECAFERCSALKSIEIPNGVTWIGEYVFSGCSALESIEIPNSVNFIGSRAFNGCNSLTKAVFVDGIVELEILDLDGDMNSNFDLFDSCPLEEVYLGRNLGHGAFFAGQENLKKVSIGNTVTKISSRTFERCSSLESVSISNSVTTIGYRAFKDCSALKSIEIPNGVTWIGECAFEDCSALESIEIPNGVTWIGEYAFARCSALESLLLGSGLSTIGICTFHRCSALKVIKSLNPTPPAIESSTFDFDKEACQLIVPKGKLANYRFYPYWREFLNISDDLLALNPLPIVRYGDGSVNLADYAPEGVSLTYESSNSDVAKIEGSMLTICGAGEATVSASIAEEGTPMEIIGQMRTFIVNKADLTVTAESYEIEQGDPLPDFAIKYDGFVYDDNADSLDELPMIICEATETSKAGEYEISLKGGTDSNYNMNLINGRLIIKDSDAVDNVESDNAPFSCVFVDREIHISGLADSQIVYVYDTSGLLCYYGDSRNGEVLTYRPNKSGMYIVKSGRHNVKVLVM